MRVAGLTLDVVERDLPYVKIFDDRREMGGSVRNGVLRLHTDEGIDGYCTVGTREGDADNTFDVIVNQLAQRVVGSDVADRQSIWSELTRRRFANASYRSAVSSIDAALWDLAGKAANQPVHRLLGTVRSSIPAYATYPPRHSEPAGYAYEANELKSHGFTAYKIHPGVMDAPRTVEAIRLTRTEVGPDMNLMLDANSGYDLRKALRVAEALDEARFAWFEDPFSWRDFVSLNRLTSAATTPINISDAMDFGVSEVDQYVTKGFRGMIRGSALKLGITGLKRLCDFLSPLGMNCEIALAGSSLLNAANLQVSMAVSNCSFYEYWLPLEGHHWGVIGEISPDGGGLVVPPDLPGLGFELDEDWISAHTMAVLRPTI